MPDYSERPRFTADDYRRPPASFDVGAAVRDRVVALTADLAFAEGRRLDGSLGESDRSRYAHYTGEAYDLLLATGYEPGFDAPATAAVALRAYAHAQVGVGDERAWTRARRAWRSQAAVARRSDHLTRPTPSLPKRSVDGVLAGASDALDALIDQAQG